MSPDRIIDNAPDNNLFQAISKAITEETTAVDIEVGYFYLCGFELLAKKLEKLIFPVGFYHTKAKHLKLLPDAVKQKFGGELPQTVEELCELPGVGRKTANLVVAVAFDKPAICVDVHVHRICNRLGLLKTKTPFDTEMALRKTTGSQFVALFRDLLISCGEILPGPRRYSLKRV